MSYMRGYQTNGIIKQIKDAQASFTKRVRHFLAFYSLLHIQLQPGECQRDCG